MKRLLLKITGYLSVGLALAGALVPMMPTTPFLLLAVYCFSRCDDGMNRWLLHNRLFGEYLRNYEEGLGIPVAIKISTLVMLWSSMTFTAVVFTDRLWAKALLIIIALFVSIHILHIKTYRHGQQDHDPRPDAAGN